MKLLCENRHLDGFPESEADRASNSNLSAFTFSLPESTETDLARGRIGKGLYGRG